MHKCERAHTCWCVRLCVHVCVHVCTCVARLSKVPRQQKSWAQVHGDVRGRGGGDHGGGQEALLEGTVHGEPRGQARAPRSQGRASGDEGQASAGWLTPGAPRAGSWAGSHPPLGHTQCPELPRGTEPAGQGGGAGTGRWVLTPVLGAVQSLAISLLSSHRVTVSPRPKPQAAGLVTGPPHPSLGRCSFPRPWCLLGSQGQQPISSQAP